MALSGSRIDAILYGTVAYFLIGLVFWWLDSKNPEDTESVEK